MTTVLMRGSITLLESTMCISQKLLASRLLTSGCKVDGEKIKSQSENSSLVDETEPESSDDLVEPKTCCMSGCANCVWIQYAEKLSSVMNKSSEEVQKIILEKVQDPNMRSFLSMELRMRNTSSK